MTVRHIHRDEYGDLAIYGKMSGGTKVLHTLEDPEDLIKRGVYTCKKTTYHKGGYLTYEVTGVEGRSRILFHIGNTHKDTEGCILLGMERGNIADVPAVLLSKKAFNQFMDDLGGVDDFILVVT